jgi:hypothetical protein
MVVVPDNSRAVPNSNADLTFVDSVTKDVDLGHYELDSVPEVWWKVLAGIFGSGSSQENLWRNPTGSIFSCGCLFMLGLSGNKLRDTHVLLVYRFVHGRKTYSRA